MFNPAEDALEKIVNGPNAVADIKDLLQRQRKRNPYLWIKLGEAYYKRRYYAKARECVAEALKRSKDGDPRIVAGAASLLQQTNGFDEALQLLDGVEEAMPGLPPIAMQRIGILDRFHRLDEVKESLGPLLKAEDPHDRALFWKGKLHKRKKEFSEAETSFRDFLAGPVRDPMAHMEGWNELAKTYEAMEDFPQAMESYLQGKELMKEHMGAQIQKARASQQVGWVRTQRLLKAIDADTVRSWVKAQPADKPHRFGVLAGHPRSGTTLLEQVLDSHSDLVSSDETLAMSEQVLDFLQQKIPRNPNVEESLSLDGLSKINRATLSQRRRAYIRHSAYAMGGGAEGRFLLDKNPALTPSLPLILKAFPETKIVLALRDPRNVVLSAFQLWVGVNSWSVGWLSLEDAVDQYSHAMSVWKHLRELLPEDQFLEVKYENLVDDLESEGRRATNFLGLEWEDQQQKFYEHAQQKRVASPTYAAVTEKVYRTALDKWKNYEEHFAPLLPKFEPWLKAFDYDA